MVKKKWMRWLLGGVAGLVALAALLAGAGVFLAQQKMQRHVEVPARPVALRDDAASIERGRYLYASRGCVDCHGTQGGGRMFLDDGKGMRIAGPNITTGAQGVVARYTALDWVRSIRHGVSPGGRPLMPIPRPVHKNALECFHTSAPRCCSISRCQNTR